MHEVDERLDEIEQILALYESKLDLPQEFFENIDEIPVPEVQQQEIVARTENPLQNVMVASAKTSATRARTEVQKKQAGKAGGATDGGAPEKKSFVPPPPKDSAKIPAPAGMPKVKTFPISTGPPPNGMSFPGLEAAAPAQTPEGGAPAEGAGAEEEVDDGFTPEQRSKNHLE